MKKEYEDKDQRLAVCSDAWGKKMGKQIDVEIFAIGKWNGLDFTIEDLNMIALAFNKLKDNHQVPLKMGHNDEQPFTDGQPALGWVDDVWVKSKKLMARLIDVPEIVYDAFNAKLYRNVSVELDMGVEYKGEYYTWVLSGVALLGADIPAVNTLADLQAYMSKKTEQLSFKKRVAFTAISTNRKEDIDMDELEKARAELARIKAEKEAIDEQLKTFSSEKAKIEAENAKLKAEKEQKEKEERAANFKKAKEDMLAKLEDMVKSKAILPAQREKFMADFKEDEAVIERLNFTLDVLASGATGSKDMSGKEEGKKTDKEDKDDMTPDIALNTHIQKYMVDHKVDFSIARKNVMKAYPDLAVAYRDMNGEVGK